MKRNHTIVLGVIVAAIAAVVVLNLPSGDEPSPIDYSGGGNAAAGTADARSGEIETDSAPSVDVHPARTELAAPDPVADLHPSVRAALTGFTGRVVDPFGNPVAESLVRLFRFAPDALFRPNVSMFVEATLNEPKVEAGEDRTGQDGRFTIRGVFPRAVFLLHADADGDAPTYRVVQRAAPPGELTDLGDIQLAPCGVLTGVVYNQDGEPVPDALVRAVDLPGTMLSFVPLERFDPEGGLIVSEEGGLAFACPSWAKRKFDMLPIPATRTDSEGAFRLTGVAPGGNLVAITARGYLSNVRPRVVVDPGEEKDLGKLVVPDGEYAFGKVVDDEDRPVEGAQVLVAARSANIPVHFGSMAAPTNAEGVFELGGFPPGDVLCAARRGPGEAWLVTEAQPVTKDLVIHLPSVRTLTLDVVDPDGERVAAPKLQITPGDPDEGSLEQAMWGVTAPLPLAKRTARDDDDRIVLTDLPKGKYTLLAASPTHATTAVGVDLTEKSQELRIELRPKSFFDVQAVDPEGAPVAGAAVYARAEGSRPRVPEAPIHVGTTSEEGTLRVDEVSASRVALTASHPAFGNADLEVDLPPAAPIVLQFQKPGVIEGIVSEAGAPPPLGKWMVYLFPRGGGDGAFPDMPQLTSPDGEGRFRIGGLRPGRYTVGVQSSLDVVSSAGKIGEIVTRAMLQPNLPSERVEVASGGRTEVALDTLARKQIEGPTGIVRGSVMVDGRLGSGYIVQGWGQQGRLAAEVDAAGLFDLGPVPVGNVNLQLIERPSGDIFSMRRGFGSPLWSTNFQLEESQTVDLTIDVQLGRIEGFVIGPDGAPVAGAMVTASGSSEGGGRNINLNELADASGRFEFPKAPAGTYSLEARAEDAGRGRLTGVVVEGGLPTVGVRVQLAATHTVRGTVDLAALGDPDAEGRRRGWVMLESADDGSSQGGWSQIREDGAFTITDVAPGSYKVRIVGTTRGMLEHDGLLVVGNADLDGFVLRPIEPEPQNAPTGRRGGGR